MTTHTTTTTTTTTTPCHVCGEHVNTLRHHFIDAQRDRYVHGVERSCFAVLAAQDPTTAQRFGRID